MPRERFEYFERNLVVGARPQLVPVGERRQRQLETAGMRPVFVLTPLNEALVRSFASCAPGRCDPARAPRDRRRREDPLESDAPQSSTSRTAFLRSASSISST